MEYNSSQDYFYLPSEKDSTLKGKNLLPLEAIFFSFWSGSLSERIFSYSMVTSLFSLSNGI